MYIAKNARMLIFAPEIDFMRLSPPSIIQAKNVRMVKRERSHTDKGRLKAVPARAPR
jgi:hypothetical protein